VWIEKQVRGQRRIVNRVEDESSRDEIRSSQCIVNSALIPQQVRCVDGIPHRAYERYARLPAAG
jgi:hypothetical protein